VTVTPPHPSNLAPDPTPIALPPADTNEFFVTT
jgi:hypothetical protein